MIRNLQALFVAWSKRFKPLLPLTALMLIAILLTFLLSPGASAGATLHLFESPVVPPPAGPLSTPPPEALREAAPSPTPLPQEPSGEEPIQPTAAPTHNPRARPTEPPTVVLDRGLLIDSILVYMSYIWLCCGILAILGIPLIFLILHVWGSQRRRGRTAKERS